MLIEVILGVVISLLVLGFFIKFVVMRNYHYDENDEVIDRPKFKSEVVMSDNTVIGDIGIYESDKTIVYSGYYYQVGYTIEVEVLSVFDGSQVKVKVINVVTKKVRDTGVGNTRHNNIITKFNREIKVGLVMMLDSRRIIWRREPNEINTSILLCEEDLGKLVRYGELRIGEVNIELPMEWDYKKALDVVIEATVAT